MKKVLSVMLAVMLCFSICLIAGAIELDVAETVGEQQAVKEEASLLALPIVPGLNIYTGTEDVLTFDTETDKNNFSIAGESGPYNSISIANIGTEEQPENVLVAHRAAYTGKSNWCGIGFSHTAFDGARKYRIKFSLKFNVDTENLTGYSYWGGFTHITGNAHKTWSGASAFTNWLTDSFDITPVNGYNPNFRFRVGTGIDAGNCAELNTYLDNVAVIPFYKVTYTGLEDIYTLGENRSYTIDVNKKITDIPADKLGYEFIGWSTTENATEPMTSVTLANEDITLYPVWKKADMLSVSAESISATAMEGGIYNSVTVLPAEGTNISIDVGYTRATYVTNNDGRIVITAAGYPGVVTVTATKGNLIDVKKIRFIGGDGDKFLPGVDLLSGTDEGFGFDGYTANEINSVFSGGNLTATAGTMCFGYVGVNPGGQSYYSFKTGRYPKSVIGDRPVRLTFDTISEQAIAFLLDVNNAAGHVRIDLLTTTEWQTTNYDIAEVVPKSSDVTVQIALLNGKYGFFDNIKLTPFYKVIYYGLDGQVATEGYIAPESSFIPDPSIVDGATGYALTYGGEEVAFVELTPGVDNIELYAVQGDKKVSYMNGDEVNTVVSRVVEENVPYTIPALEEIGYNVENFRVWTDGTLFYVPGSVVENGGTLVNKILKPVCFAPKLFDPVYGELVYFFDYENAKAYSHHTFINSKYATSTASRTDGTKSVSVATLEDGSKALKVSGSNSGYSLFGYGFDWTSLTVGATGTLKYDLKYDTPELFAAASEAFFRMVRGTGGPTADDYYSVGLARPTDTAWHRNYIYRTKDTNNAGLKGFVFQYSGLSKTETMTQYWDNIAYYIYPAGTFTLLEEKNSDNWEFVKPETEKYTFTTSDNNVVYYTNGRDFYLLGVEYNVSDLSGKVIYPVVYDPQNPTPAMIFNYEGDTNFDGERFKDSGINNKDLHYSENVIDDGRDVLHIGSWKGAVNVDYRLMYSLRDQYDPYEYSIFQTMLKTENITKKNGSGYEPLTGSDEGMTNVVVYFHWNGSNYYGKALYQKNTRLNQGEYGLIEHDTTEISRVNGCELGYGFCLDPTNIGGSSWGHDIYLDYFRMYRRGPYTVTYNTNAPAGADIYTEVAPDLNRGVGEGYLLKGQRPAVSGYSFMGWALTPDATKDAVINSIDLLGDTEVYAVWEANTTYVAPTATDEIDMKSSSDGASNGIRFKATITNAEKATLNQFGFIATRESLLPTMGGGIINYDALNFNLKKTKGSAVPGYVTGIAYDRDNGIDIINSEVDGDIIYTAVTTGIPLSAKNEPIVIRTFAKHTFGDKEMVVFGATKRGSLYDTALAIRTAAGVAYESNKAYIDSILAE